MNKLTTFILFISLAGMFACSSENPESSKDKTAKTKVPKEPELSEVDALFLKEISGVWKYTGSKLHMDSVLFYPALSLGYFLAINDDKMAVSYHGIKELEENLATIPITFKIKDGKICARGESLFNTIFENECIIIQTVGDTELILNTGPNMERPKYYEKVEEKITPRLPQ